MTDAITLEHRTRLLTRRVRAIMRAFSKNPKYLSDATPNITWDDSFIPRDLYDNMDIELATLKAKESQQTQKEKARETQMKKIEAQMAKEKAKVDGRKMKETAQDPQADDNEKLKRNLTRKTFETIFGDNKRIPVAPDLGDEADPLGAMQDKGKVTRKDTVQDKEDLDDMEETDDEEKSLKKKTTPKSFESVASYIMIDDTSSDAEQPAAKRVKRKKSIEDLPVPPCQRCTRTKKECIPNGWSAACKRCRSLKMTCSLVKTRKPNAEKPHTTTLLRSEKATAVLDSYRSSIEDDEDDADQLDPQNSNIVMVNLPSAKTTTGKSKEINLKSKPPKASSSKEGEGSSPFSSSRNFKFDLERTQQQLKVSQEELRIVQQQLQLANSRIEAQQKLYESQRDLYEAQLASYRSSQPEVRHGGQGSRKAKERK